MFKLTRKASTLVLLILMIASCFLLPLLVKVNFGSFNYSESSDSIPLAVQKTHYESRIVDIDAELTALEGSADSEVRIYDLQMEKDDAIRQLESINLMIDNGITGTGKDGFVYDAIATLPSSRMHLDQINDIPENERDAAWTEIKEFYEEGIEMIYSLPETKDFRAYLDFKNRTLQANTNVILGDMFTRIFTEQNDLWYQLDPSGGTDGKYSYDLVSAAFSTLNELKSELYSGFSYEETASGSSATSLSPKKEAQLIDQIAVLEYRIENKSLVLASDAPYWSEGKTVAVGFGQFLVTLLLLIIAGSAISQEIATGSIKSLIIAPVRRWKIYTAKMLAILSTGVIGLFILWAFSNIGSAVIFGTKAMVPYVYTSGENVHSIPYLLYDFLSLFAGNISTLVYCIMAFTLSIITRNTAFSVGSSVAILFTTSTLKALIDSLATSHQLWMDFLPFNHFNLSGALFPFKIFMDPLSPYFYVENVSTIGPSLQFSVIYLIVLLICLIYTGFDAFTRQDIK